MQALIVDDEEQTVINLQRNVDWKAAEISRTFGALSAREARRILEAEEISLILCDIEMPGESGLDLIEWLREEADFNGRNYECIILTCYPDYRFMRRALQMGCRDYLLKPVDYSELGEAVKKAAHAVEERKQKFLLAEPDKAEPAPGAADYTDHRQAASGQQLIKSKVIPYLEEHFAEAIPVPDIAAYAALNPQYLMRVFKKETGLSILEYVTELRMKKAAEILRETDWNNELIAERCGYISTNYFIRLFKKHYGMTPGEYRRGKEGR